MLTDWAMKLPWDRIEPIAYKYKLDPTLVASIIWTESRGDPCAARYEPKWRYLFNTTQYANNMNITHQTEIELQKFSYGLMQVMGSVAREMGFSDELPRLYDIDINLEYGCKKLAQLRDRFPHDFTDMISAYNQGGPYKTPGGFYRNQTYVDKVMGYFKELNQIVK